MGHPYTRVPVNNNKQGWGVAGFIVVLALATAFTAWTIHKRTYVHPRSPISTLGAPAAH